MSKKILTTLLTIIMLLIALSCCKKSLDDLYFETKDMEITNTHNFRNIGDGVTVSQLGYKIKITLKDKVIEAISDINDLRASFDYCEDNFIGLKKDISNLKLSCNKDIWNTVAGVPLDHNNIRLFENKSEVDSENIRLTVQEWLNLINNEDQLITFEWFIEFIEAIDSTEFLKFQLLFELADGSEYITETESVRFE